MATATESKPRGTAEKYVYDALRGYGVKFKELDDAQRRRAMAAPTSKAGLRGKALAHWIVTGEGLREQSRDAQVQQDAAAKAASAKRRASSGRKSPYPDDVREAVKRANEIRGKSHGAGPKQHVHVRRVVTREVDGEPTTAKVVELAGVESLAELHAIAAGEAPRERLKALRPLAEKMGDDPWCKGRHLAAALAAWTDQMGRS